MSQVMRGLPPTSSNGFGVASVSGRMRSPRPAARIIAFTLKGISHARHALFDHVEKADETAKLGIAFRHGSRVCEEAGRVVEIAGLAVTVVNAREDAEHLEMALQAHPLERAI